MSKRSNNTDENPSKRVKGCCCGAANSNNTDVSSDTDSAAQPLSDSFCSSSEECYGVTYQVSGKIFNNYLSTEFFPEDGFINSSKDLPDIRDNSKIILYWHVVLFDKSQKYNTTVLHNEQIIWQQYSDPQNERAEYMAFMKYAIRKYGLALYDVIPNSDTSLINIYANANANATDIYDEQIDALRNALRARNNKYNSYFHRVFNWCKGAEPSLVSSSSSSEHNNSQDDINSSSSTDSLASESHGDNNNNASEPDLSSSSSEQNVRTIRSFDGTRWENRKGSWTRLSSSSVISSSRDNDDNSSGNSNNRSPITSSNSSLNDEKRGYWANVSYIN